jgi:hypothetical protein
MQLNEILSLAQTTILLGGLILGIRQVVLLSNQISLATKQLTDQLEWQKKQVTFHYLSTYTNELKDCNLNLQRKIGLLIQNGEEGDNDKIIAHIKDDKSRAEFFELVSYFEHLAIGLDEDYFSEPVAAEAFTNVVISTYYLVKPYLLHRRKETGYQIGGNFEKLAKRWEIRRRMMNKYSQKTSH